MLPRNDLARPYASPVRRRTGRSPVGGAGPADPTPASWLSLDRIGAIGASVCTIAALAVFSAFALTQPQWLEPFDGYDAILLLLIWLGVGCLGLLLWQQRRTLVRALAAERAAETAKARLRDAIESISESFTLWDADDRLVLHNRRYVEMYPELAEIVRPGIPFDRLTAAYAASDGAERAREHRAAWVAARRAWRQECLGRQCERCLPDGRWLRIGDYRTAEGGIVSVQSDITEIKQREFALAASEERYRTLTESSPIGIGQIDREGRWRYANPALCALLQVAHPRDVLGRGWLDSIDPSDRTEAARLQGQDDGDAPVSLEVLLVGRSGRRRDALISCTPLLWPDRTIAGKQVTVLDITERKEAERRVRHLAHHDALCGLPNRVLFGDRLRQALRAAAREDGRFAVCALDLDNFKDVNDSLGHAVGDLILKAAAERLQASLRAADTVARLSGDEFALILHRIGDASEADAVIEKVTLALRQPYHADEHVVHLSASTGIALYPEHGQGAEPLMRHADMALYQVKAAGGNGFARFELAMSERVSRRKQIESDLRRALDQEAFRLLYQPQIDLRRGTVVGAEALLRWQHPSEGWISPAEFIPVAEACGLIVPLGHWVLDTACRQARSWRDAGLPAIRMSVNLSTVQIRRSELPEVVAATIAASRIEPAGLELEITESVLMDDTGRVRATLERLRTLGVGLSLDDFGTGFSSLGYLKRFPVDRIKIDQSFVADIGTSREDDALVTVMIDLAHSLGMEVIAEGVEQQAQLDRLGDFGCDQVQGFHLARPMPPDRFAAFLGRRALVPSHAVAAEAT